MTNNDLLELYTDISRQHLAYVEQRVGAFGLHAGQAAVISALGRRGSCTQKELAEIRHVSAPTISIMTSRMMREGLIVKHPEDSRYGVISLSEKGKQMCEALAGDRVGEPERIFAGLSSEEMQIAEKIFLTISRNLQQLADGK